MVCYEATVTKVVNRRAILISSRTVGIGGSNRDRNKIQRCDFFYVLLLFQPFVLWRKEMNLEGQWGL